MHVGTHKKSIPTSPKHIDKSLDILEENEIVGNNDEAMIRTAENRIDNETVKGIVQDANTKQGAVLPTEIIEVSSSERTSPQSTLQTKDFSKTTIVKACSSSNVNDLNLLRYDCSLCGMSFITHDHLRKHMMSHPEVFQFKCDVCEKKFRRKGQLQEHECCAQGMEEKEITEGADKAKLTEEQEVMNTEKNGTVAVMDANMSFQGTAVPEMKVQTKKPNQRTSLKKRNASKLRRHGCDVCGKHFLFMRHLEEHMMTHTKVYPFKCNDCERKFRRNSELKQHVCKSEKMKERVDNKTDESETHRPDVNGDIHFHGNTICKMEGKRTLKSSSKICSTSKIRRHGCNLCGKRFIQNCHLREHMMSHTKVYPFKCDVCERKFKRNSLLKQHKCLGQGIENEQIARGTQDSEKKKELVDYILKTEESETHQPDVNGDINFHGNTICKMEGQTTLKSSSKSCSTCTSKIRRHGCNLCGKRFIQNCHLREHMMSHTKVFPFKCDVCERKFKRNSLLKQHKCLGQGIENEQIARGTQDSEKKKELVDYILKTEESETHQPDVNGDINFHGNTICKMEGQTTLKSSSKSCSTCTSKIRRHGCNLCGKRFIQKLPSQRTYDITH